MSTIALPLSVLVTKKRHFWLNLNQYRNTHFQTLNKAKANFKEAVEDEIKKLGQGIDGKARWGLWYKLYPPTRRLCDVSNICSVVDKFFSDALVELNVLEDDNYNIVREVHYLIGQVDKANPRAEFYLVPPLEDIPGFEHWLRGQSIQAGASSKKAA